jgi:Coenzyme PQQ synthesis protein D (PqqD)
MRFFSTEVPKLVSRQFGDEVVLANYETGLYYCMTDNAAKIWLALRAGWSDKETASAFASHYSSVANDVASQVSDFIAHLTAEGIILPIEGETKRQQWELAAAPHFEPPLLERFDDLRNLLLLDPVHDVDDKGWPVQADDAS